jgi:hypothetical protein
MDNNHENQTPSRWQAVSVRDGTGHHNARPNLCQRLGVCCL